MRKRSHAWNERAKNQKPRTNACDALWKKRCDPQSGKPHLSPAGTPKLIPKNPGACVDSARDSSKWAQQTGAHFGLTSSRRLQVPKPDWNPNTSIRHSEPESAMATRSEGLLQLAYADHKRYGCDFNWQVDRALKANDPAKTILPAEEQSRMWSEDPSQPDHYPAQTLADPVGILVDVAAGRTELPCIRQANDKSPYCMWFVHQVDDRQSGYDEVRAGRREAG